MTYLAMLHALRLPATSGASKPVSAHAARGSLGREPMLYETRSQYRMPARFGSHHVVARRPSATFMTVHILLGLRTASTGIQLPIPHLVAVPAGLVSGGSLSWLAASAHVRSDNIIPSKALSRP